MCMQQERICVVKRVVEHGFSLKTFEQINSSWIGYYTLMRIYLIDLIV